MIAIADSHSTSGPSSSDPTGNIGKLNRKNP